VRSVKPVMEHWEVMLGHNSQLNGVLTHGYARVVLCAA
jgi:hypothetical protein